jgi:antitoxin component of MazEF toxin-antitoxin module
MRAKIRKRGSKPPKSKVYDLKLLVAAINEKNLHNEYMVDKPKGKEVW